MITFRDEPAFETARAKAHQDHRDQIAEREQQQATCRATIDAIYRAFRDKRGDGSFNDRVGYMRDEDVCNRDVGIQLGKITVLNGEIEDLRLRGPRFADVPASTLRVSPIEVPTVAADRALRDLRARQDQATGDREASLDAIGSLEPLVNAAQQRLAEAELKHRHGLATKADIDAARSEHDRAQTALNRHHATIAKADTELLALAARIADREHAVRTEIRQQLAQLVAPAIRAAADALLPAAEAVQRLDWLLAESECPRGTLMQPVWAPQIVGGHCGIQEFLELAHTAFGWNPKTPR
jgi:hypothetical protein